MDSSMSPAGDPEPYAPPLYSNPNATPDPCADQRYNGDSHFVPPDASYCYGYGPFYESETPPKSDAAGMEKKPLTISNVADLNIKMQRVIDGGAPVNTIKVCTACNVVCNSAKAFAIHCEGAKHVLQVRGMLSDDGQSFLYEGYINLVPSKETPAKNKVQTVLCEVCKIECNSLELYNIHITGKKHRNKAEKLNTPYIPKPIDSPAHSASMASEGSDSEEGTHKVKKPEDLEMKKRKVIEGGAAANAVRVCMLCNVVCNSETVFQKHVSGQKHKNAIKNQEGGATSS